jgi:hypothetical protein
MELVAGTSESENNFYSFELKDGSPEEELHSILAVLQTMPRQEFGFQMETYMGLMARCTEIKVYCLELEGRERRLKILRTQKLQPIMDLIEFLWRAVSRLIELKKIEAEMSK